MITVHKSGTLGNNMWQYAVARVIAEKNNLKLNCYSIPGFPKTFESVDGNVYNDNIFEIHGHYFDMDTLRKECKIELYGYVQRYEYIKLYKNKIREWFELDTQSPINVKPDDFVVSIRRGTHHGPELWNRYPTRLCPSEEYFLNIFNKVKYKRIILCTDSFEDPFFKFLNFSDVEVIKAQYSPLEQFALIKSANKIMLTASTYCWWAAFLSNATEIYYPWIEDMIPTETGSNWMVNDENRYIILN